MEKRGYTMEQAAELLGESVASMRRWVAEGAFPGRFLGAVNGRTEMLLPIPDVDRERQRRSLIRKRTAEVSLRPQPAPTEEYVEAQVAENISAAPGSEHALTTTDLEALREAMVTLLKEERTSFLGTVRQALLERDQRLDSLTDEIRQLRAYLEGRDSVNTNPSFSAPYSMRETLVGPYESQPAKTVVSPPPKPSVYVHNGTKGVSGVWKQEEKRQTPVPEKKQSESVDVEALLREISDLEAMLGSMSFD